MKGVKNKIAAAISKADSRFFFENYSKQAEAVLAAIEQAGLVIVPKSPTEAMIEQGVKAIQNGRTRPTDLVTDIYVSMARPDKIDT